MMLLSQMMRSWFSRGLVVVAGLETYSFHPSRNCLDIRYTWDYLLRLVSECLLNSSISSVRWTSPSYIGPPSLLSFSSSMLSILLQLSSLHFGNHLLLQSMTQTQPPRTANNRESIQLLRFKREIELIKQKHDFEVKELEDTSKTITFHMNVDKLNTIPLVIHIPAQYPFAEPKYSFEPPEGYLSKDSYGIKKPISVLLGDWNPGMRLSNVANEAIKEINKGLVDKSILPFDHVYQSLGEFKNWVLLIGLAVFIRVLVGLGSYSGEGHPPEYGDFQAQRNWMSIAWNRPASNWYHELDQKPWWRLDYPPVAGYLSYICALFMRLVHPKGLQEVRGYQQLSFKTFMRMTVLFTDLITFFIPVLLFHHFWKINTNVSRLQTILILFLPPFILIDHGHFQYNCIMLGLVLGAYLAMIHNRVELTCALFTIALSTKQMAMYYALGFFAVLLGKALYKSNILNTTFRYRPHRSYIIFFSIEICRYALNVGFITILLWLPWISTTNPSLILQPLGAIFPVHRGLYQLKVPNFWCFTDVFFKWETRFSNGTLVVFCALLSLIGSIPSIITGILVPQRQKITLLVFLNISLSFFLFSYHVHEKTILVPLLFVGLTLHMFGKLGLDFVTMSSFVMYHLLKEDEMVLQYFAINLAFLYFAEPSITTLYSLSPITYEASQSEIADTVPIRIGNSIIKAFNSAYKEVLRKLLYLLIITLHFGDAFITPPTKLPYLFHLLFSSLGFIFFLTFWIISNIRMITDTLNIIAMSNKKKMD